MKWITLLLIMTSCSQAPKYEELKKSNPSSFKEFLDSKGELIHETRVDFNKLRRTWVSLNDLPEDFTRELIEVEDQRFYSHWGVDLLAAANSVRAWPKRGASTITMQVVKLMSSSHANKSVFRKIMQMMEAILLEFQWTKKDILEAYINLAYFKGELQGLSSASRSLFNKYPQGLTRDERMILLAMLPGPNQSEDQIKSRACRYLKKVYFESNCSSILNRDSLIASIDSMKLEIPHVALRLSDQKDLQVLTTIESRVQEESRRALSSQIRLLQDQNVSDGAVLVINKKTAKILAYVGSSGSFSKASQVDHITSLRQAGSTLKPLLFSMAIQKKLITMTTPLKDAPFSITREGLTYQPENYQKSFTFQNVPAKIALGSSLNIPAIRVIDYLTPERFYSLLEELQFRELKAPEHYGHSMALGAVDVTLWDLVRAYRAMSEGDFKELSFTSELASRNLSLISKDSGFIISKILSDKTNRALTFGIQSTLATDSWSAVKTGTSKDMRDNWCVGYTDKYVIGVWIGNSSGSSMHNVSGITGAAPIFSHLVSYLHRDNPSKSPDITEGVIEVNEDYYLKGTEPVKRHFPETKHAQIQKILFPQNGAQFAFDPEIPERNQQIQFKSTRPGIWKLNGKRTDGDFFPGTKGKYVLDLFEDQQIKDSVTFFVKAGKN